MQAPGRPARAAALLHLPFSYRAGAALGSSAASDARDWETHRLWEGFPPWSSAEPSPLRGRGTWTLPVRGGHHISLCHLPTSQTSSLLHGQMADGQRQRALVLALLSHPAEVSGQLGQAAATPPATVPAPSSCSTFVCRLRLRDGWC